MLMSLFTLSGQCQLSGVDCIYLQVWDFMFLYSQFLVFIFIDILRNASDTLPRIIIVCSVGMYIRTAFASFEDAYRSIKEVSFAVCKEFTEEIKGKFFKVNYKHAGSDIDNLFQIVHTHLLQKVAPPLEKVHFYQPHLPPYGESCYYFVIHKDCLHEPPHKVFLTIITVLNICTYTHNSYENNIPMISLKV